MPRWLHWATLVIGLWGVAAGLLLLGNDTEWLFGIPGSWLAIGSGLVFLAVFVGDLVSGRRSS